MALDLEVTSHDSLQVEFKGKICELMVSGFVMIWKEGHVWMPQLWKQGQVQLIPKKDKPQTIGDARPITLLNAHHNMHSHMVAWWLRDSMTTMCLPSHCVFLCTLQFESFCQLPGSVLPTHSLWESGGLLCYHLWPVAVEGM